jgi:hypothetical protein
MESNAPLLIQLGQHQEQKHAEPRNAVTLLELQMINVLDKLLERLVFQMARFA